MFFMTIREIVIKYNFKQRKRMIEKYKNEILTEDFLRDWEYNLCQKKKLEKLE